MARNWASTDNLAGPNGKTTCSGTVRWEGLGLPWCYHRWRFMYPVGYLSVPDLCTLGVGVVSFCGRREIASKSPHTPVAKYVWAKDVTGNWQSRVSMHYHSVGRYMIPNDDIMGTNHEIIHLSPDMSNNLLGIPRLNYHLELHRWYQAWGRYSSAFSARTGRKLSTSWAVWIWILMLSVQ